ncbi:MAG: DUF1080 domain-containing protein [Saprospiraceae bacterium]|nr:DUF1080 domain-containing protein [Saprospiraceae bacterium]
MKHIFLFLLAIGTFNIAFAQEPKPEDTEVWEPQPQKVTPGFIYAPPSDAIVLFDGRDLSEWQKPQFKSEKGTLKEIEQDFAAMDPNFEHGSADWLVEDGSFTVVPGTGAIETKRKFGDMQLHIEWLCPQSETKTGQNYSNSGLFIMGLYELQILNNYKSKTYANGQAGAIYKQKIPLVNASRPPGEWQMYDVIFTAPRFNKDGSLDSPAYITVFHNGVLVQNHVKLDGPTAYIGKTYYFMHPQKMPIRLQDHDNPVRFRNIWVRAL